MSATQASSGSTAATDKPIFTERETGLLQVAMLSLKSGAPEIDIQKFMVGGNFNTIKTAQNTWGAIKKKLAAISPPTGENGEAGSVAISTTPSEKKSPVKRTKKVSSADDEVSAEAAEEGSPVKKVKKNPTPRKTAAQKKAEAAAEAGEEGGADTTGSPVKKVRKTPVKKTAAAKKSEAAVKEEELDTETAAAEKETTVAETEATAAEDEDAAGEDAKMEE